MKTLIVYDSLYGNTKRIAQALAESLSEATVIPVDEADLADLKEYGLVIVGSPTQGGRPTPAIKAFLGAIPPAGLRNIGVTAFDTRISAAESGPVARFFLGVFGYAAGRIGRDLQAKGGRPVAPPEGFLVKDKEGPLEAGEAERAAAWARRDSPWPSITGARGRKPNGWPTKSAFPAVWPGRSAPIWGIRPAPRA